MELSNEELRVLYEEHGSISALARHLERPQPTVRCWLVRAGIELKRSGFRSPRMTPIKRGKDHHNWRGGTYIDNGYIAVYAPDHPASKSRKGYVFEHRLVMERELGRRLEPDELVHHINGVKTDNRPENLQLTAVGPHMRLHKATAPRDGNGRFVTN